MKNKRLKKLLIITLVLFLLAGVVVFGYRWFVREYTIKDVSVEGSVHYTEEEIKDIVMAGKHGNNSFFLSLKYKNKEIESIPFVETINVSVEAKDRIRIVVYEKALAGFVEYLGRYIYFDKDGIVVESSMVKTAGVPEVVGVDFDYIVLHEKLPAKDDSLFKRVLNMTQLMTKYKVDAEKMYFKDNGEIVLYYKDITINLGKDDDLDIKVLNLPSLLKNLEGMSGTLRMENYNENTKKVSFEPRH